MRVLAIGTYNLISSHTYILYIFFTSVKNVLICMRNKNTSKYKTKSQTFLGFVRLIILIIVHKLLPVQSYYVLLRCTMHYNIKPPHIPIYDFA